MSDPKNKHKQNKQNQQEEPQTHPQNTENQRVANGDQRVNHAQHDSI